MQSPPDATGASAVPRRQIAVLVSGRRYPLGWEGMKGNHNATAEKSLQRQCQFAKLRMTTALRDS